MRATSVQCLPSSTTSSNFWSPSFDWIRPLLGLAYCILAMIGFTFNLAVAYALLFARRRALRNITNFFVLVLTFSDLCLCSITLLTQAYYELVSRATLAFASSTACRMAFSLLGFPIHVSCLTILLIACDRYQIIIYPLRPRMSARLAGWLIGLILTLSLALCLPVTVYSEHFALNVTLPSHVNSSRVVDSKQSCQLIYHLCIERWPSPLTRLVYSLIVFVISFLLPLLVTAGLYSHIFYRLRERRSRKGALDRKRRTSKILVRIVLCFILCWTPWNSYSIWLEIIHYKTFQNSTGHPSNDIRSLYAKWRQSEVDNAIISSKSSPTNANCSLESNDWSFNSNQVTSLDSDWYLVGNTTRVVDILLKLLAAASSCINPWLYGWLNKYYVKLFRAYWHRRRHTSTTNATGGGRLKSTTRWHLLLSRVNRLCATTSSSKSVNGGHDSPPTECTSSNPVNGSFRLCCCCLCGTQCSFEFSLCTRLYTTSNSSHARLGSGRSRSSEKASNRSPGNNNNNESCEKCGVCNILIHVVPVASACNRLLSDSTANTSSSCGGNGNHVNAIGECQNCGHRQGSKNAAEIAQNWSRASRSSLGLTTSALDPSTKLTSLLPTSGYTRTPRESLCPPYSTEGRLSLTGGATTGEHRPSIKDSDSALIPVDNSEDNLIHIGDYDQQCGKETEALNVQLDVDNGRSSDLSYSSDIANFPTTLKGLPNISSRVKLEQSSTTTRLVISIDLPEKLASAIPFADDEPGETSYSTPSSITSVSKHSFQPIRETSPVCTSPTPQPTARPLRTSRPSCMQPKALHTIDELSSMSPNQSQGDLHIKSSGDQSELNTTNDLVIDPGQSEVKNKDDPPVKIRRYSNFARLYNRSSSNRRQSVQVTSSSGEQQQRRRTKASFSGRRQSTVKHDTSRRDFVLEDTFDVDDFARLSRLVALEAMSKKQRRVRTYSLAGPASRIL